MSNGHKQVVLVEDEVFVAMSMSLDLRNAGYDVAETLASGEAAVEFLRENSVDIVLMDIGLVGDVDGVEAARRIRVFSTVPIVFMSGYANRENDPAVSEVQPLDFLAKPVSFHRLRKLLEAL